MHKIRDVFVPDCKVFAYSPAFFSEQDENEEGLQFIAEQKFIEEFDLIVACFIVVECVEKSKEKIAQPFLKFGGMVGFMYLQEDMFLQMSA